MRGLGEGGPRIHVSIRATRRPQVPSPLPPPRRVRQVNFVFHDVAPGQELSRQAKCHQKADPPEPGDPVSGRDSGRTPAPRCTPAPRRCGPFAPGLTGKERQLGTPPAPAPLTPEDGRCAPGTESSSVLPGSHSCSSPKAPSWLPPSTAQQTRTRGLSPASRYGNEHQDSAEAFPCAF